jgi:hypothetical protein
MTGCPRGERACDALRDAKPRQLGVDVRPWSEDHLEIPLVRHAQEPFDVEARVEVSEIELAVVRLVHAPRHVGVDELETQ